MAENHTVFILGAGASQHLGYPIGSDLVLNICQRIRDNTYSPEVWNGYDEYYKAEKMESFSRLLNEVADYNSKPANLDKKSIDKFLGKWHEFDDIGRRFIHDSLSTFEGPVVDPGWYKNLDRIFDGKPDIANLKVSIFTFNYDTSLDRYLTEKIKSVYEISEPEANEMFRRMNFFHLYGKLTKEFPKRPYTGTVELIFDFSEKDESGNYSEYAEPGHVKLTFAIAKKLLDESARIVFMGFGFDEFNLSRFQFFTSENLANREVIGTSRSSDLSGNLKRGKDFGFNESHFPYLGNCDKFCEAYQII